MYIFHTKDLKSANSKSFYKNSFKGLIKHEVIMKKNMEKSKYMDDEEHSDDEEEDEDLDDDDDDEEDEEEDEGDAP